MDELSDTKIRNAKPADKEYTLADGQGLSVVVRPNGTKLWLYRYRFGGKRKNMSFGTFPGVGLKSARQKRHDAEKLLDHERPYMPSVAWFYPESRGKSLRALPPVPVLPEIAQRRYRYSIEGDKPPWRPVNAYDDGRKVYVEFSPGIVQGEMPPLFVVGADGKPELANSRAYGNVLIVDRLFAAAELRLGGESQQIVQIVRTDGRPQR